jgi:hypothetical protein
MAADGPSGPVPGDDQPRQPQPPAATQMQPDTDYALCHDNPSQVCTVEEGSDNGSTSGTDTSAP